MLHAFDSPNEFVSHGQSDRFADHIIATCNSAKLVVLAASSCHPPWLDQGVVLNHAQEYKNPRVENHKNVIPDGRCRLKTA